MNTVYGILRNEKYSGTYMHGDEVVDKIYPPIVDPEIFAQVRAKVSCNKIGKHSNAVVNLLRQKMKCGYCGENMSGECGTSKQGVRTYYYKCHGRKNLRNGCKQQPYRKEILEKFVLDSIIAELKKPGQKMNEVLRFPLTKVMSDSNEKYLLLTSNIRKTQIISTSIFQSVSGNQLLIIIT